LQDPCSLLWHLKQNVGKQEACEGCISITRAAGVCSRTLCERRICRLLFHYKYSLQQIFTPDFNCNAACFLENLTKLLTQLPLACCSRDSVAWWSRPPPTYSEKGKENLSTEEKSDRNERRSLVGSCTTVQFPSLSPPPLSLSL
jgi:hypothetical protein